MQLRRYLTVHGSFCELPAEPWCELEQVVTPHRHDGADHLRVEPVATWKGDVAGDLVDGCWGYAVQSLLHVRDDCCSGAAFDFIRPGNFPCALGDLRPR